MTIGTQIDLSKDLARTHQRGWLSNQIRKKEMGMGMGSTQPKPS